MKLWHNCNTNALPLQVTDGTTIRNPKAGVSTPQSRQMTTAKSHTCRRPFLPRGCGVEWALSENSLKPDDPRHLALLGVIQQPPTSELVRTQVFTGRGWFPKWMLNCPYFHNCIHICNNLRAIKSRCSTPGLVIIDCKYVVQCSMGQLQKPLI